MLELQNTILEMIARGDTLESTATRMCQEAEKLASNVICSVLTIDRAGLIHPLAGPSLPRDYSTSLDGVAIGPNAGSCGTAAYLREEVTVTDIAHDPRWASFKHLALPFGLKACWSKPILNVAGDAIGTFAFYYRECRGPSQLEREIVQHCVHLCVIALERHQRVIEHERRAFTDALTGLANRAAFDKALDELSCDVPGQWALIVLDLDNFKIVNDTFGHHVGDALLRTTGARISAQATAGHAFRIGGDEFAIILKASEHLLNLERTAEAVLGALAEPAQCGDQIVVPRATLGGAILTAGDRVAEQVRQNADFALYHAKETGRGGFVRYWPGLGTNITRRLGDIREVDAALREDRIDAHYQPVVRLDTREIVGLEALCRMRLGDRIISAADFQEATKDVHVARALTARMMTLVAADLRVWLDMGVPFQHVGVNVSSADMHGGTLETVLTAAFERENVPLKHVIIEVTETVYMGDGDVSVQKAVESLRAKGFRVALDDFGTGYASLTHLLTVPVDIIKIDKSFVDRLAPGNASMAIIEGLLQIARKLDIRVIAEGIETEDQASLLQAAGCILGQGYLFSRAVNRHATTKLLLERAQRPDEHLVVPSRAQKSQARRLLP
ncbi:bifunctional diguanylate cyclase/phosphodiesterase [Sphingomonas radiodurans]|uniref:bifunctional diguanylate cyclase/phosphodiesterase n=1 Tax=Sphingomonas radiodurans TaxID=2890321 RepID=UPI001E56EFB8|nr:GGDEF domain-containing protein [Sphingomonas radiodurans]WBH18283.1 GGDEF domain-containing protein [Sphingomonas radiodurans]